MLQVDVQLGLICVGEVEASFVRALVAFNDVQLPDEEALQQYNTAISAMRVKRSVDCLLSGATETSVMHRAKLRSAGPASAVSWMLRAKRAGSSWPITYDQAWTPMKRLASVAEQRRKAGLMVDAVWEDISDGSQRIYCQLPYSRLTHVDPMWEDMSAC